jgi:hypothetical protein
MLFTFDEWLAFWKASGKLHLRGLGRGKYVMARNGDRGPYAPDNVRIILFEDNMKEKRLTKAMRNRIRVARLGTKASAATRAKMSQSHTGRVKTKAHRQALSKSLKRSWQERAAQ